MRKSFVIILILIIGSIAFVGCSDITSDSAQVVCSIFPQYDFCRQITKGKISVEVLLKSDVDVHNYELTLKDKSKIKNCDLFIYIGGTSEAWFDAVNASTDLNDVKILKLLDTVECNVDGDHNHNHDAENCDEHIWTSLKNAIKMCASIKDKLCEVYPQYAEEFNANYSDYVSKLAILDSQFANMIANAKKDIIIVADRFPFKHFASDYDLNYLSAFDGCTTATDVPILTKIAMKNSLEELNLKGVIVLESGDRTLANSIIEGTDKKIYVMHSCQTIKVSDYENNVTYLELMQNNYQVLSEVLND